MMEGKTKFFWLHGVSRSGVHRALSDSKRSIYYRRTFRQALVIVSVIATSTLVVAAYLSDGKTQSYTVGVALALTIVLYMLLRKSCRLIAESPAELLDERLLEIRNQAYYVAYQMLAFSVGLLVSFIWMASRYVTVRRAPLTILSSFIPERYPHEIFNKIYVYGICFGSFSLHRIPRHGCCPRISAID